jgi:hypothetical protein
MRSKNVVACLASLTAAGATLLLPAGPATADNTNDGEAVWLVLPSSGPELKVGDIIPGTLLDDADYAADGNMQATAETFEAKSAAVAAVTWGSCGVTTDKLKVLRTFNRVRGSDGSKSLAGGKSNLACGNEKWGYKHIVKEHLEDWQNIAAVAGENWRDTADLAISSALGDPDEVKYGSGNDTFCFSHLIYLADKKTGKVEGTNRPRTIVAHETKNIINAFPASGC